MSELPGLDQYKYKKMNFNGFSFSTWLLKSLGRCVWLVFVAHILLQLDSSGLDFPKWLLSIFLTSPATLAFFWFVSIPGPHWYWKCRLARKQSWPSLFCTSEPLLTSAASSGNSQLPQLCTSMFHSSPSPAFSLWLSTSHFTFQNLWAVSRVSHVIECVHIVPFASSTLPLSAYLDEVLSLYQIHVRTPAPP